MFICNVHASEATKSIPVDYIVYSCGGAKRGCGSIAHLGSGGGPQDPCPDCGQAWKVTGKKQIAIGYCEHCWPSGVPDQIKPSYIPVSVVGGFVALKPSP
jgi:hypothetical protein